MGLPPMPHQQQVWNTALEVDEQGFVYRTVVFTVPRQGGKTQTTRVVTTWWGLSRPGNLILSTAQSGLDARLKWGESMEDLEGRTFFRRQMKRAPRRANGTESVVWKSGTRHRPVPPIPKKSHGETVDLAIVDEAWAFRDEAVLTALRPAMMTRDAQLWIISTAGTEESVLLRRHVEMGRRAVANGDDSGIAYFEWAAEDDDDPDDPETWLRCIPTIGRTVSLERIAADKATLKPEDFERSYLNRWIDTGVESTIPWGAWLLANETEPVMDEPLWLCADISPERDRASIVAAGTSEDGTKPSLRLVDCREGVDWLPSRIDALKSQHDVQGVVVDGTGPAATLEQDLTEPPELMKHREMTLASQAFLDAVVDQRVVLRQDAHLTAAMRSATKLGNGDSWRWSRKRSRSDITPLVASTLAWWKARENLGAPSLRIF
jgi:hypothetical protein